MKNECRLCKFKSGPATKLNDEEIEKLSLNCALVSVRKGDSVIRQGTFSTNVAYLRSGLAKIHIAGPYFEQIVRIVRAPSYLALPTTFGDKINQYSVTVIEPAEVCFIDINAFRYLLANNPEFSYEVLLEVCRNELDVYNRCANRTQKQIRGKIADVLLEMSERIYCSESFKLPVSQEEMGNLIDSSRESVSRVIAEFIKDGIIKMKGRSVEILRKDMMKIISTNG
ncbi:MAG TPA: Crp/Fnr family transcriptional regulator [Bacteroidales bacterium]|nr:Crp/Fnr family transcriptional regulator [Bacteroidales bacterium]HPF02778.1 Crp/Fnr family transcriptional regulator [Bacteroidales bacterium]HPJ58906.1 Crp/Fnr family transcriptional regulator [Bacteroidales bacterium]HPR12160.1 Crp/Fnr family transcriptional regulator [Bacteroidales bacterium]HRW84843.1 Crp/Fnr family transcriptional regulator [Bacteroidales bacterium]